MQSTGTNFNSIDDMASRLVSMTDLRRNAGEIFDKLPADGYLVVKDGKPVGKIVPIAVNPELTKAQDLAKIRRLAGGLKFHISLTADQMNKEYDKMYGEMFPRQ